MYLSHTKCIGMNSPQHTSQLHKLHKMPGPHQELYRPRTECTMTLFQLGATQLGTGCIPLHLKRVLNLQGTPGMADQRLMLCQHRRLCIHLHSVHTLHHSCGIWLLRGLSMQFRRRQSPFRTCRHSSGHCCYLSDECQHRCRGTLPGQADCCTDQQHTVHTLWHNYLMRTTLFGKSHMRQHGQLSTYQLCSPCRKRSLLQ